MIIEAYKKTRGLGRLPGHVLEDDCPSPQTLGHRAREWQCLEMFSSSSSSRSVVQIFPFASGPSVAWHNTVTDPVCIENIIVFNMNFFFCIHLNFWKYSNKIFFILISEFLAFLQFCAWGYCLPHLTLTPARLTGSPTGQSERHKWTLRSQMETRGLNSAHKCVLTG